MLKLAGTKLIMESPIRKYKAFWHELTFRKSVLIPNLQTVRQ